MGQINEREEEVGSWVCGSRWMEFILRLGVCLPNVPEGPRGPRVGKMGMSGLDLCSEGRRVSLGVFH